MQEYLETIASVLEDDNCVLFLGPRFGFTEKGEKLHTHLQQQLQLQFAGKLDYSYDNLFLLKNNSGHEVHTLRGKLRTLYREAQQQRPDIYQHIAQLPFCAIVNCTPDHLLKNAFESLGLPLDFQYYSRKGQFETPTNKDAPLLFNVFGNVDVPDSLLITYEAFFDFMIAILGEEQQISLRLKHLLTNASVFVFIGFDLEKWYIPLLLNKLSFHKGNHSRKLAYVNTDNLFEAETYNKYPIQLVVMESETLPLIEGLYQLMDSKNLLRQPEVATTLVKEPIKQAVAHGDLDKAVQLLMEAYKKVNLDVNDVVQISSRHALLKNNQTLGIINFENARIEQAQIQKALLNLTDML